MTRSKIMGGVKREPEIALALADAKISWVLNHPYTSEWLKEALRSSVELDPIMLQNDVEMLRMLVLTRAQARIELAASRVQPA